MSPFIAGAIFLGYLTAALLFLKFWKETGDRLFVMFAIAFAVLGSHRALMVWLPGLPEVHSWLYFVRLLAFLLILFAILDKNRTRAR
jgi:hypothetical protein